MRQALSRWWNSVRHPNPFPWYDSEWLHSYVRTKRYLVRRRPELIQAFEEKLAPLRTDPAFKTLRLPRLLDEQTLREARELIQHGLSRWKSDHEWEDFGRYVVHDHPFFVDLQRQLTPRMAEWVGEEVEPRYCFLSLYRDLGQCPVHMDSPTAKWTLDICINQSSPWPLYVGPTQPWPEQFRWGREKKWEQRIKQVHPFEPVTLEPGDGAIFSGSAQWHYREAIPNLDKNPHCDLVFLHYVPKGYGQISNPGSWAETFGEPRLKKLTPFL